PPPTGGRAIQTESAHHSQSDRSQRRHPRRQRYRHQPAGPRHLLLHVAPRRRAGLQRVDARGTRRCTGAISRLLLPGHLPQRLPSYDLWEERWGVHAFTVAAVIAGLRAAGHLAKEFGESERAGRYWAAAERMLEGARAVLWNEQQQRFARMATPSASGYTLDMT